MDVVGVFTVAFITAFGGGTLRDILLDRRPLFWVLHQEYAILIFILALVAAPLMRTLRQILSERLIVVADAIGLGLFAVAGVSQAQAAHMPLFIASMMGVITGIFGGVLRDIVCNEVPMVFRDGQTLRHLRLLRLLDVHRPAIHRCLRRLRAVGQRRHHHRAAAGDMEIRTAPPLPQELMTTCPKRLALAGYFLSAAVATAAPISIEVRGSQLLGPDQQDVGEADWLARLNNWKRDPNGPARRMAGSDAYLAQHPAGQDRLRRRAIPPP